MRLTTRSRNRAYTPTSPSATAARRVQFQAGHRRPLARRRAHGHRPQSRQDARAVDLQRHDTEDTRWATGRRANQRLNASTISSSRLSPKLRRFKSDAASVASKRGYVRTILGRRQHFPPQLSTHVAVSRVIQGSAGDHMKVRLLEACQWVEACGAGEIDILMTIHDAVIWQAACGAGISELREILRTPAPPLNLSSTRCRSRSRPAATGPRHRGPS